MMSFEAPSVNLVPCIEAGCNKFLAFTSHSSAILPMLVGYISVIIISVIIIITSIIIIDNFFVGYFIFSFTFSVCK